MFFRKKESDSEKIFVAMDCGYIYHENGMFAVNGKKHVRGEQIYDLNGIKELMNGCLTILAVSNVDMDEIKNDLEMFFRDNEERVKQ